MRILIADDNERLRDALIDLLANEPGWEVCAYASTARDTLAKTRDFRPDLILLDINMPDASGFETTREIRHEFPELKILIMSHNDVRGFLPGALEAGANGCVDKARLWGDLVTTIRGLDSSNGT
jgi:two-component system response regulator DegU